MKRVVGIWIYLIFHFNVQAQHSMDMGLIISPSYSIVKVSDFANSKDAYINRLNYGFKVQMQENRLKWSAGIMHLTLGYINYAIKTTTDFPGGTGEFEERIYRARGVTIPIIGDYILKSNSVNRICIGLGITPVFFYSQKLQLPNSHIDGLTIPDHNNDFELLPKFYYLFNIGFSYEYYMNERWLLSFRPCFLYQYNSVTLPGIPVRKIRSSSFGFDIGISYVLGK